MSKNPVVTITMKSGKVIKAELYPDIAPNTVNNFISLWAYEQEVRLVMPHPHSMYSALTPEQDKHPKESWDWREIHRYMPLKGDCFESIYFGVNTEPTIKEKIIKYAREELNPQIKLYQMRVDENAFRLNPEMI